MLSPGYAINIEAAPSWRKRETGHELLNAVAEAHCLLGLSDISGTQSKYKRP